MREFVRFLVFCISCHESAFRATFPHLRGILWYGRSEKEGTRKATPSGNVIKLSDEPFKLQPPSGGRGTAKRWWE